LISRDAGAEARRVEEEHRDREREEEKRRMEAAAALKAGAQSKLKETTAQPDRVKTKTAAPIAMRVPFTFFITSVLTVPIGPIPNLYIRLSTILVLHPTSVVSSPTVALLNIELNFFRPVTRKYPHMA